MTWRLATVAAVALTFAAAATAGSVRTSIPAPAVGKARVERLTIKASHQPKIWATNLPALGRGFGAVVILGRSRTSAGTWVADIVMFMGNASSSPPGTVDVQVSGGTPVGTPVDESGSCKALRDLYDGNYSDLGEFFTELFRLPSVEMGDSSQRRRYFEQFVRDTLAFLKQQRGCS